MATKLNLTVVDSSSATPSSGGANEFVKFNDVAAHSTFVIPQDDTTPLPLDSAHHAEMQAQAKDFLVNNKLSTVSNAASVLE
ncbi:hypothetical protein VCRA2119O147_310001 [Vibrio crassostreae]|nr:hypothetical protein VCRA2119O147_310001 [Vibrio crassostreae]